MSGMSCPNARALFEDYSRATIEFFEATDKLSALVGRHEEFAKAKKHTGPGVREMPRFPSSFRTALGRARMPCAEIHGRITPCIQPRYILTSSTQEGTAGSQTSMMHHW